jgi:hypothetical protein
VGGLDHLQRWLREIGERPAVKRAMPPADPGREGARPGVTVDTARKMLV